MKAHSSFILVQWRDAFTEINTSENLIEELPPTFLENEKIWVAELYLMKGLLTEIFFGELDLAINIEHQAYDLFTEVGDYRGASRALNYISSIYFA